MADLTNPVTGLAAGVGKVRSPAAFHVYATQPPAGPPRGVESPWHYTAGSGRSDTQARVAAIAEVAERYSQATPVGDARVHASLKALGERAIHPNACMLFSDRQYRLRRIWNARGDASCRVPRVFDPGRKIDWVEARSLLSGEERFVPAALVHLDSRAAGHDMCVADTNGCAAGETLDAAVTRGFLELVERDSIALWWYTRASRPAVNLATIDDTFIQKMLVAYAALGRELWVLDLTTDLGVPCYGAVSRRVGAAREEIIVGFGAAFDPVRAVEHAVAEVNQTVALLAMHDLDRLKAAQPLLCDWLRRASIARDPYLAPGGVRPIRQSSRPGRRGAKQRVALIRKIVQGLASDLLVVDLTRPDVGVPVAKVLVPGLRPAAARFAPGRLFAGPLRLGRRSVPLAEEELNPQPFFF